jgi:hypothetical protein
MFTIEELRETIENAPGKTVEDHLRRKGLHAKERIKARKKFRREMLPGGRLHDLVQTRKLRLELKSPPRPDPVDEALSEYRNDAVPITEPEPEPRQGMEAVLAIGDPELTRAVTDALHAGLEEGEVFYMVSHMKPRVAVYQLSRATNRHQAIQDKDRTVALAEQLSETCQRIEREVAELRAEMLESPDKLRQRLGLRQRPRTVREEELVQ